MIYLSFSRLKCWEQSKELYYKRYILGERYTNKFMEFGSWFADLLESKKKTDNPRIERLKLFLPEYPKREEEIRVKYMGISLLAKPDGINWKKKLIGEFKTGKQWTQGMADKSDQLTFYAMVCWILKGKLFKTQLHWIATIEMEDGGIDITGFAETFKTERTIKDFLLFWPRIERAWAGINKLTKEEYSKI